MQPVGERVGAVSPADTNVPNSKICVRIEVILARNLN